MTFRAGIWCLDPHPDGKILASASPDSTCKLWDINSGATTQTIKAHDGKVFWTRFSQSGNLIATAGDDYTAKIWNVKNLSSPINTFESNLPHNKF